MTKEQVYNQFKGRHVIDAARWLPTLVARVHYQTKDSCQSATVTWKLVFIIVTCELVRCPIPFTLLALFIHDKTQNYERFQ